MPKACKLTELEKGRIEVLKFAGISNREIAKSLNRSHDVVNKYVRDPLN
jgi:IS30 family transposase